MRRLYTVNRPWVRHAALRRAELVFRSVLANGESDSLDTDRRPSVPPVLLCGLGAWGGCAAVYSMGQGSSQLLGIIALVIGIAGALSALVFGIRTKRISLAGCLLGVAIGVVSGSYGIVAMHDALDRVASGEVQVEVVELLDDARDGSFSRYATGYAYDKAGARYKVKVFLPTDGEAGRYGEVYTIHANVEPSSEQSLDSSWNQGVTGTVSVKSPGATYRTDVIGMLAQVRNRCVNSIKAASGSVEARGVLAALVCGYRVDLYEGNAYVDFKICGLAHLVAVSGAHLSLVTALLGSLLGTLRVRKRLKTALQVLLVFGFLVFTAIPISALRAALMAAATLVAFGAKRRPSSLNALGLCLLVFVAFEPQTSVSVSLALSASSVLGILLFGGLFRSWVAGGNVAWQRRVGESIATTTAASVLSTPLSACVFNQLPLVSPLANLVAAPLFSAVCLFGVCSAFASLVSPEIGSLMLGVSLALCDLMCAAVHVVASLPFASIPFVGNVPLSIVVTVVASALLWRTWPKLSLVTTGIVLLAIAVSAAAFLSAGSTSAGLQLVTLDVGQGDAILVRDESEVVLVDTGKEDQKLLAALARQGIIHLDALVLTHADADHVKSLAALKGVVQVDRVVVCADALSCPCDNCMSMVRNAADLVGETNVIGMRQGDEILCGRATMRMVWPTSFADEGGNGDSLCLLVDFDADLDGSRDARALLCGDAEDEQLDEMLDRNLITPVDIYKVGHHGSKRAIDDKTAQRLSPKISLVSVGQYNSYGHPAPSTLESLRLAGSTVYRTDQSGDLVCSITENTINVFVNS